MCARWFHSDELEGCGGVGSAATVVARDTLHTLRAVHQLNKDEVLVCHDNVVELIPVLPAGGAGAAAGGGQEIEKKRGKLLTKIEFNFTIDAILCVADSVLAFHRHGVQGRSLRSAAVTQEVTDHSRRYRLLPHDKVVVLESHNLNNTMSGDDGNDLYILAGHEASY
ncbi:CNH domain-containing protein [Phthorimaea operculella]|nr:CNH domain-containing protein [Phthorimaea operculella]